MGLDLVDRTVGLIGLGQMGSGIAANLLRAGYDLLGYDLRSEALDRLTAMGGRNARDAPDLVARSHVVLTCVEGKDAIRLADEVLLQEARPGQVFVDHSTIPVPQAQRIGQAFVARGCGYLDAPISGGKEGAAAGTLRVFVGGDRALADALWPLFEAIGNPDKIVYCGPIGMGQAAKVVQQLTHRFPDVARMEVMAFGLLAGLDLETVRRALDVDPSSDEPYARLYRAVRDGETDNLSGLFSEWAYYLEAADAMGFEMPMLRAMYEFCEDGPETGLDPLGRPQPSIWNELLRQRKS